METASRAAQNALMSFGVLALLVFLLGGFQMENVMRVMWRVSESYVNESPQGKFKFKLTCGVIYALIFGFVSLVSALKRRDAKRAIISLEAAEGLV